MLTILKTIHSLQICHLDIKIDNIGWSPSFQKFILLDFTFTKFVKQRIGYKSMTSFYGTFHYASLEMKKIFWLRKNSYVDLYYHDLYGLEKVLMELVEKQ